MPLPLDIHTPVFVYPSQYPSSTTFSSSSTVLYIYTLGNQYTASDFALCIHTQEVLPPRAADRGDRGFRRGSVPRVLCEGRPLHCPFYIDMLLVCPSSHLCRKHFTAALCMIHTTHDRTQFHRIPKPHPRMVPSSTSRPCGSSWVV